MKIILSITFACVALGLAGYFGSMRLQAPSQSLAAASATESVVIPVKGMACMACVAKAKQALRAVEGVAEVEINLKPGRAIVKYDSSVLTPEQLVNVINGIGYQAGTPVQNQAR